MTNTESVSREKYGGDFFCHTRRNIEELAGK